MTKTDHRFIRTSLAVGECGEVFRRQSEVPLMGHGRLARMAQGSAWDREFFTPSSTPFDTLESDPPQFIIGCQWTSKSLPTAMTIQMAVWDRGGNRIVQLSSGDANRLLDKFELAFTQADPASAGLPSLPPPSAPIPVAAPDPVGSSAGPLRSTATVEGIVAYLNSKNVLHRVDADGNVQVNYSASDNLPAVTVWFGVNNLGLVWFQAILATRFHSSAELELFRKCNVWNSGKNWPMAYQWAEKDGSMTARVRCGLCVKDPTEPQVGAFINTMISEGKSFFRTLTGLSE